MKAYRELEHRGLAAGRPGQGTFNKTKPQRVSSAEQAALASVCALIDCNLAIPRGSVRPE